MFKEGDKVVSEEFGEGIVTRIAPTYPVVVKFPYLTETYCFTSSGNYYAGNSFDKRNIKLLTTEEKEESSMKYNLGDLVQDRANGTGTIVEVRKHSMVMW